MIAGLLIAWVGLLMASRMDFLLGEGPIVLTPFLVLSPIILALEGGRLWTSNEEVRIPEGSAAFFLTVTALSTVLVGSTFLSYELAVAAGRLALLVVQVYTVFLMMIVIANRPDPRAILLKGAYFGLAATLVWNVIQSGVLLFDPAWLEPVQDRIDLRPDDYFGVVPRLTGVSHDPNHGGLFALFLVWLVTVLAPPSRMRTAFLTLGVLSIVATLSRSAALAGMAFWFTKFLADRDREVRVTVATVGVAAVLSGLALAAYLVLPSAVEPIGELGSVLSNRLTLEEASGGQHARLMLRGWEVGTDNLRHLFLGIGYGNAFIETQDIFPGNDYGNFHSLFLTLFVEGGIVAAGLIVWLFLRALRTSSSIRPMIAALLVFNLFQQSHTEPILWLCLMLAWLEPSVGRPTRPSSDSDVREPLHAASP